MAEYYTKKGQVPLKPGEKLGYTAGRGYYAIAAAPAKTSASAKLVSTEELGGLSVSQAEQVAGNYGLTTTTDTDEGSGTSSSSTTSTPPTKHATQPSKAPSVAAKTPAAAEAAAKSMITDAYRPVVFETSTKAKPNAVLIAAAHRQGGTVADPVTVAKTTKPTTANAKKNASESVKAATATTNKKTALTSTAPAAKHPAVAAATTFYGYKKDVHLKPGQTLAYTAGKGYYAKSATTDARTLSTAARGESGPAIPATSATKQRPGQPAKEAKNKKSKTSPALSVTPIVHHLTVTLNGRKYVNEAVKLSVNNKDQLTVQVGKTRVVIKPTAAELSQVKKLQTTSVARGKIAYPLLTVIAAKIADVPLTLVCAVMQDESYEGKNVWGDDKTIFRSGGKPVVVTKSQYLKYKQERGKESAQGSAPEQQGVGPGQLTDAYLQDQADKLGGAWKPLPNMIIAFSYLKQVLAAHPGYLAAGLGAYNGSGPTGQYATDVLSYEREWAAALGVESVQRRG